MNNNLKKLLSLFAICFLVFACAKENDRTINPQTVEAQGGVDVGNMSSSAIPYTNASLTYPGNWTAKTVEKVLTLTNISSSTIKASRAEFTDLVTSTQLGLKQYLESKYPGRTYEFYEINGLSGVRAEIESSETSKKIDIYLMSELQDLIHIYGDLNKADNGVSDGENIVSTVRVKYQGTPVENAVPKTVTLERMSGHLGDYSFSGDCFSSQPNCTGVSVKYGFGKSKKGLVIGIGRGYQRGRIVELGHESEISFDSIKIDGEYLVSPKSKVSIADVYTTFTPETPNVEQRFLDLKKDHIYLIRTIGWPTDDLVLKLKVNDSDENKASVTYEKLVGVKSSVLQKQIDAINKNTIENEMPMESGEITLYNHTIFRNIVYSSFNFQYSTMLNRFITNDSFDLLMGNVCDKKPTLVPPPIAGSITGIVALQAKSIELVTKADFPDVHNRGKPCDGLIEIGKTYGLFHHRSGKDPKAIYGAVQVIDLDKDGNWVRLKFRRISVEKPQRFQVWEPKPVFFDEATIKISNHEPFFIHDFLRNRGYETVSIDSTQDTASKLVISSCMYENDCGFFNFGNGVDLKKLTVPDLEKKKGQFHSSTNFFTGDVIGVYSENYNSKVILVFRVEEHSPGKSVVVDAKYLYRATTTFGNIFD